MSSGFFNSRYLWLVTSLPWFFKVGCLNHLIYIFFHFIWHPVWDILVWLVLLGQHLICNEFGELQEKIYFISFNAEAYLYLSFNQIILQKFIAALKDSILVGLAVILINYNVVLF